MATQTANLGLTKPGLSDQALITVLNNNFEILDGLIDMFYPVGAIYMSVNSTDPATFIPGTTWQRIKDKFLLTAGDTYSAGTTGGSATHTLTSSEMPSHNHTFTGSAVTSGGISANHTHTGTSGNPSANHTHSGPSHTHTGPNHSHEIYIANNCAWSPGSGAFGASSSTGISTTSSGTGATGSAGTGATGNVSAWHTHTTTTGNQSAGHTHSVTASGSIGNSGSGNAFSIMPPYLAVYAWKRTA